VNCPESTAALILPLGVEEERSTPYGVSRGSVKENVTACLVKCAGSEPAHGVPRYHVLVHWLIDGYNLIRRSPELGARERESLDAGRGAFCELLSRTAQVRHDEFTVVFDGAGGGGATGVGGVRVVFSSARESADRVLARMAAARGGAVVSSDREVLRAARRVGAIAVTAEAFLARIEAMSDRVRAGVDEGGEAPDRVRAGADEATEARDRDEPDDAVVRRKKGNPRRLGKKARAAARALGRLKHRPSG